MFKRFHFLLLLSFLLSFSTSKSVLGQKITTLLCKNAIGFENAGDLDQIVNLCSDKKLVLLGESTHGTEEFYQWRAQISKRLIEEKGYNFIAVEGDWASIYRLNLYVKGLSTEHTSARDVLKTFKRWPEWMWANTTIEELAEWLKVYNKGKDKNQQVGFYGMDVYGQWEAMDEVIRIAEELIPHKANIIRNQLSCFAAFSFDEWQYARAVQQGYPTCQPQLEWVVEVVKEHLESSSNPNDKKALLHAKQSAKVVKNAEDFYRLAIQNNVSSWNSRVLHMNETVNLLLQVHGDDSKGIVWAHNTHIGDAQATSMANEGMVNIGQLSRQTFGNENVMLIGFTTYNGRVNAGSRWGAIMSRMRIPNAMEGSAESLLKSCNIKQFYIVFDEAMRQNKELLKPINHRAIGVVYNPANEQLYNYVPSVLPMRYDVLFFIKTSSSLEPISLF
jgi:erythromycin esterase